MKKAKTKKIFFGAIMFVVVGGGLIFLVLKNQALALSPNYSKSGASNPLSIAEWNNLRLDFLAKSGEADGVMTGELNMSNLRIANVGDYIAQTDMVTKAYVDSVTTAAGGGAVFTNWGDNDCPSPAIELYEGIAFGSPLNSFPGSSNSICLRSGGTNGPSHNSTNADKMMPLVTPLTSANFPVGYTASVFVKCATCFNDDSSCYYEYGGWDCSGSFSPAYQGYLFSSIGYNDDGTSLSTHFSSRERICINRNFDSTAIIGSSPANSIARMYGSKVYNNFGQASYAINEFVRCALCCN